MLVLIYSTQCVKLTIFFIIMWYLPRLKFESSSQSIRFLNYILNLRWFILVLLESLVNMFVIYFLSLSPPPKQKKNPIFFFIFPQKNHFPGEKRSPQTTPKQKTSPIFFWSFPQRNHFPGEKPSPNIKTIHFIPLPPTLDNRFDGGRCRMFALMTLGYCNRKKRELKYRWYSLLLFFLFNTLVFLQLHHFTA